MPDEVIHLPRRLERSRPPSQPGTVAKLGPRLRVTPPDISDAIERMRAQTAQLDQVAETQELCRIAHVRATDAATSLIQAAEIANDPQWAVRVLNSMRQKVADYFGVSTRDE